MDCRYLAFDIEIAKILPADVDDLKAHRPLGITCAATLAEGDAQARTWFTEESNNRPAPRMSRDDLSELVDFLSAQVEAGFTILTWNGLGFDFDILAEESGRREDCKRLALGHVDMMFHVFCEKGFPVGLEAAAQGMGLRGKPPGMSGALAPELWAAGKTAEVLDYVAHDCEITLEVASISQRRGSFAWITRRGSRSRLPLRSGWLSVEQALRLPKPDTSWMTSPMPRTHFTGWLR